MWSLKKNWNGLFHLISSLPLLQISCKSSIEGVLVQVAQCFKEGAGIFLWENTNYSFNIFCISADTTAPVVTAGTCPTDVTQVIEINSAPASVPWTHPRATDNSGETPTRMTTHEPGSEFNLGNTEVTYTFCDTANNCDMTCSFNIFLQERKYIIMWPKTSTVFVPIPARAPINAHQHHFQFKKM